MVNNINERKWLEKAIDKLVYNYLISNYRLWTNEIDTALQVGSLYIGPNNAYLKDSINYNHNFCETK